jgi:hypothetical protein
VVELSVEVGNAQLDKQGVPPPHDVHSFILTHNFNWERDKNYNSLY